MDVTKLVLAIFTLALTISLQIQRVEGRHMKHHISKNTIMKETTIKGGRHDTAYESKVVLTKPLAPTPSSETLVGSQMQPPPSPPHGVEDFRPTAPGHSPGAGHAVHN